VREPGRDWTEALAHANTGLETRDGRFTVDRVVVVHSQLSPRGSIYRVRAEAPLAVGG
jgi:hypothetical protein